MKTFRSARISPRDANNGGAVSCRGALVSCEALEVYSAREQLVEIPALYGLVMQKVFYLTDLAVVVPPVGAQIHNAGISIGASRR